jgi:hypothetical protein
MEKRASYPLVIAEWDCAAGRTFALFPQPVLK